jgi:hypothetical protein
LQYAISRISRTIHVLVAGDDPYIDSNPPRAWRLLFVGARTRDGDPGQSHSVSLDPGMPAGLES